MIATRRLVEELQRLARPAWRPVVTQLKNDAPEVSKYGGVPFVDRDHLYPTCRSCKRPLNHLLQLDLADLPLSANDIQRLKLPKPFSRSLLQLFVCSTDDSQCLVETEDSGAAGAFSVRLVPYRSIKGHAPPRQLPDQLDPWAIVGWQRTQIDYPSFSDLLLELEAGEPGVETALSEAYISAVSIVEDGVLSESLHESGDKLSGWPSWNEDGEELECLKCGTTMEFLFQIGSRSSLPYRFPGSGRGYIFICPKDFTPAFTWQMCQVV